MLFQIKMNPNQTRVVALTASYVLVSILLQLFHGHQTIADRGLFTLIHLFPPLFAGLCGLKYSRERTKVGDVSPLTSGWLLIALAALVWAAGQALCAYYQLVLRVQPPVPSEADAFYLPAYVLIFGGIYLLFGSMPLPGRARLILDSTIAVSGVAIGSWYFIVKRLWHVSHLSLWSKLVTVAYPLADIVALFSAIMLLQTMFRARRSDRLQVTIVACGIAVIAFADTLSTYAMLAGAFESAASTALRWNLGWLVLGYAFAGPLWFPSSRFNEDDDHAANVASSPNTPGRVTVSVIRLLIPYAIAALICAEMMANDYLSYDRLHASTFAITYAIILLVIIRQVVTQIDNQKLTEILSKGSAKTVA